MPVLSPSAKQQFTDNAGNLAAGFRLYTYAAGTTNLLATYQDRGGAALNTNPIILDSRGEATIYLDELQTYDYALKTPSDDLVWTRQGVEYGGAALNAVPKIWNEDDGLIPDGTKKTFDLPGADVDTEEAYEVFINGIAVEPYEGFAIEAGATPESTRLHLTAAPHQGAEMWVILRGYAKPMNKQYLASIFADPLFRELLSKAITNTFYESNTVLQLGAMVSDIPTHTVAGTSFTIDGRYRGYLIYCSSATPVTITIRKNTGSAQLDWPGGVGSIPFFSVRQLGAGQVTVIADQGEINVPAGYLAKTRTRHSTMTLTGDSVATASWTASNDIASA